MPLLTLGVFVCSAPHVASVLSTSRVTAVGLARERQVKARRWNSLLAVRLPGNTAKQSDGARTSNTSLASRAAERKSSLNRTGAESSKSSAAAPPKNTAVLPKAAAVRLPHAAGAAVKAKQHAQSTPHNAAASPKNATAGKPRLADVVGSGSAAKPAVGALALTSRSPIPGDQTSSPDPSTRRSPLGKASVDMVSASVVGSRNSSTAASESVDVTCCALNSTDVAAVTVPIGSNGTLAGSGSLSPIIPPGTDPSDDIHSSVDAVTRITLNPDDTAAPKVSPLSASGSSSNSLERVALDSDVPSQADTDVGSTDMGADLQREPRNSSEMYDVAGGINVTGPLLGAAAPLEEWPNTVSDQEGLAEYTQPAEELAARKQRPRFPVMGRIMDVLSYYVGCGAPAVLVAALLAAFMCLTHPCGSAWSPRSIRNARGGMSVKGLADCAVSSGSTWRISSTPRQPASSDVSSSLRPFSLRLVQTAPPSGRSPLAPSTLPVHFPFTTPPSTGSIHILRRPRSYVFDILGSNSA